MCNIKLGPPQAPVGCVPWLLLWSQSLVTVRGQRPPRCTTRQIFLEKISPVEGVWRSQDAQHLVRPVSLSPWLRKAHTVSRLLVNLTCGLFLELVSESLCLSPFVKHLKDRAASLLSPVCQGSCIFFKIKPQVDLGLARPQLLSPLGPFWLPLTWYESIF